MEKLKAIWASFHQSPVTTILGCIAGAASWLALRPEMDHLTSQSAGGLVLAAVLALLGISANDPKPKA